MIKLIEKSNFDDIEKAVKYYYNKWYYSDMSYDDIASDLKRLGHSDDFIDAVLDGISERYEDEEDYELDESKIVRSHNKKLREQDVEIEVKHEGILEVPEGKNVDDLPFSHFEKLAKKKGLSKITKALNNLQVWNKNDDKKLYKWAVDMIDKLNKKLKKDEAVSKRGRKRSTGKSNSVGNFLDKQIESGNIDEKQVTVVYDKNNNIMWLGKAGFYPLYLSGIEYRSSGYDKDHPNEFWINARSYTEPFEENLSLKYVKRVNNRIGNRGDESMKEDYISVNGIQLDYLRESNSGGLDWSYLDPVLQEFIDWLEDDGIRVEKVNPRMKTIYVPGNNLEMASWYLRDRDYFGKEPFLKDWMVASKA